MSINRIVYCVHPLYALQTHPRETQKRVIDGSLVLVGQYGEDEGTLFMILENGPLHYEPQDDLFNSHLRRAYHEKALDLMSMFPEDGLVLTVSSADTVFGQADVTQFTLNDKLRDYLRENIDRETPIEVLVYGSFFESCVKAGGGEVLDFLKGEKISGQLRYLRQHSIEDIDRQENDEEVVNF
jgi:hypothetical protein